MSSRERILAAVKANKPESTPLPEVTIPVSYDNLVEKYTAVATAIGAKVHQVNSFEEIESLLKDSYNTTLRVITAIPELSGIGEIKFADVDPHTLADVELAIVKAEIGVAENGALWVPEMNVQQRVVPFIPQHLAIVVERSKIVPAMHQAYEAIGNSDYGYAAFIAGPSKTADIEQSLVLGAHGPRSLSVFIM